MADEPHRTQTVFDHWHDDRVESVYDKHLLGLEIASIKQRIAEGSRILDAGCGEGEGTVVYSDIPGVRMDGADFSPTRLKKAAERIGQQQNISLKLMDFREPCTLDGDYDVIVSQRFLINLPDWNRQVTGFGSYFLLTRGIRPVLSDDLSADSDFNRIAATCRVQELLGFREEFSRLKLWVFGKRSPDA